MITLTRTAYGIYLQTCLLTGQRFSVKPNTTLNEKLNILRQETLNIPYNQYPQLKYFCIGNGGHRNAIVNNVPKITPVQHLSTNASPYGLMPFVLREVTNDLTAVERQKYALRRVETYLGRTFIAYYLKRIDYTTSDIEMSIVTVENDGSETAVPFEPTTSNLSPKPQEIATTGVNVLQGKRVDITTTITLSFTAQDCEELRNVANIVYADEGLAIVSEVGLVSGIDKSVTVSTGGVGQIAINEVIGAQLNHIASTFKSAVFDNLGFDIIFGLGENSSLWLLEPNKP